MIRSRSHRAAVCSGVVVSACLVLLYACFPRKGKESQGFVPSLKSVDGLFDEEMIGKLNYDVWRSVVGYHVDDLRIRRDFPNKPEGRTVIDKLEVTFNEKASTEGNFPGNYAHKIYGYVGPQQTGLFVFSIEMRIVTAACSVELWISSDFHPARLRKVLTLEHPEQDRLDYSSGVWADSQEIWLTAGRVYYFEFLEKAFDGRCKVEIKWKTPLQSVFTSIPSNFLAMAVKLDVLGRYTKWPVVSSLQDYLPSSELQSHHYVKNIADKFFPITRVNALPRCKVNMVLTQSPKRTEDSNKVIGSKVYPPDDTWHMNGNVADKGNEIIEPKVVQKVLSLYAKAYKDKEAHSWRRCSSDIEVRYVEETVSGAEGSRFLLELNIRNGVDVTYTSEYVYMPSDSSVLCQASNYQWAEDVDVYLVITAKNLGLWLKDFIHNMEYIYSQTHDDYFEVIVVDFDSKSFKLEQELQKSSLKRWKVINLEGTLARTKDRDEAVLSYITDPNSIVMTVDLHLTIPLGFIQYMRKHVIEGKMAFAPVFFRLRQGYTEVNINGQWATWTHGLFALYRSDWAMLGGFNSEKYTGGKDWDLADRLVTEGYEIFRIRYPGLVHYHSGMDTWQGPEDKQPEKVPGSRTGPVEHHGESKQGLWQNARSQLHSANPSLPTQQNLAHRSLSDHHNQFLLWKKAKQQIDDSVLKES